MIMWMQDFLKTIPGFIHIFRFYFLSNFSPSLFHDVRFNTFNTSSRYRLTQIERYIISFHSIILLKHVNITLFVLNVNHLISSVTRTVVLLIHWLSARTRKQIYQIAYDPLLVQKEENHTESVDNIAKVHGTLSQRIRNWISLCCHWKSPVTENTYIEPWLHWILG